MDKKKQTQYLALILVIIIISSAITALLFSSELFPSESSETINSYTLPAGVKTISKNFTFSTPIITKNKEYVNLYLPETNLQSMGDGRPVVPVNLTTYIFPFGTHILNVSYTYLPPNTIALPTKVAYASCSTKTREDGTIYNQSTPYPEKIVTYHTTGGLVDDTHQTILALRLNPIQYYPQQNKISFTKQVKVSIYYKEPEIPIVSTTDPQHLLIIAPQKFTRVLQPLITHKKNHNIQTELLTVETINQEYIGIDLAEKIKYAIKHNLETSGIITVLLIGGMDGQTTKWTLPPRYSHVLIREGTQEIIEPKFLSDLYFADIYDSEGNFSSWDTNNNGIFAEYDHGIIDHMDLSPDVYLGRLPCRTKQQVRYMVRKIISYETMQNLDWFTRLLLVSGDHWDDKAHISEGIEIMEETKNIMAGFKPVELYATENNILTVRDINQALNKGAGFAYFCGHGSPQGWGIHYPPNAKGWAPSLGRFQKITFYFSFYMGLLRNRNRLPITLVGGCNNGRFDLSIGTSLSKGTLSFTTACWAWKLTNHKRGGSIATIANTGLGTHAMDDSDNNSINDYLEVYDGWLELRFLELYAKENIHHLGKLHQEAISQYLTRFLGNQDEMDIKMAQQWQLFGDPSLRIH